MSPDEQRKLRSRFSNASFCAFTARINIISLDVDEVPDLN